MSYHQYSQGDGSYSSSSFVSSPNTYYGAPMTRGPSSGSGYSTSSSASGYYSMFNGSDQHQAGSPYSDTSLYPGYLNTTEANDHVMGNQAVAENHENGLWFHYYDFKTGGDSGREPYWKLKKEYSHIPGYPAMVPCGGDASQEQMLVCLQPQCEAKTFRRKADLERHYEQHNKAPQFLCDVKKCPRHLRPFGRLDHYREHYRLYHGEDLTPRTSGNGSGSSHDKKTEGWWDSRRVDPRWWRCAKCLARVWVADKGWQCPGCKANCEPRRRMIREEMAS
ncbi:hypothetical protein F4780DRAFT_115288 [Xylariomycetidae sp. FL0641]|nr:hypothetical protein F4780DRAFT_115288 [Xylariomycetidae sp. FL0641]